MRIKVTGYFEPEDHELDAADPTGLTSEAYDRLITGEDGRSLSLMDLEDLEVEVEK
jgi:hypothetical protein